jgi:hypothetical protein
MTSIIKVDQIQLANGSTPTAGDLGLNTTGSVIQTGYGSLLPGRDFNGDVGTTSTSYINLAGSVSGTVLGASLNDVKSTSVLLFTYTGGLVRNGNGTSNSSAIYNIWETIDQKYVANATDFSGSNDPYVAGHWNASDHTGVVSWTFLAEAGQFSGNCNFQVRVKTDNGNSFFYHWHSNRVGHYFAVQEIAG